MPTLAEMFNLPYTKSQGYQNALSRYDNFMSRIFGGSGSSRPGASASSPTSLSEVNAFANSGTYRGIGSKFFNAGNISAEDYLRSERSAIAAFERESKFNAEEAEKQREFSKRAYSYAMEDLKRNGINPILAFGGTPGMLTSSVAARSSGGSSNYKRDSSVSSDELMLSLAKLIAGIVTAL